VSDLGKRRYAGGGDRLHSDMELGLKRIRDDINATAAYTPAVASDWVAPLPTTIGDALNRLAAAGGTTPVPVL